MCHGGLLGVGRSAVEKVRARSLGPLVRTRTFGMTSLFRLRVRHNRGSTTARAVPALPEIR
jgi:hypothetical protein